MKKILTLLALIATLAVPNLDAAIDRKLKVSSNDATSGYLNGKLVAGTNTTLVETSDGGNESLQINAATSGSGIILDIDDDAANESTAVSEIAIINDGVIASEPSADKLLLDFDTALLEAELDSETELETALADVTNVFTNNDGALNEDDLTNNNITDLADVTAKSGNTTVVATTSGTLTTGNLTEFDASGNIVDSGISASTSPVNDTGTFIEPVTDGDGYEVSDSGNTKGIQISHNGTEAVFNVVGTAPVYQFPDLTNCDTIDTDVNGNLICGTDATTGLGVAEVIDLGDDAINESADMDEFATTNDTNSVFTNPTAGKVLVNLANDWPKADDADDVTCVGCVADGELATDFISEAELDTEAELETQLTDVTNVFTNNDGSLESTTAGRSLTLSTFSVEADAELYTNIFNASLITPTSADDAFIQIKVPQATTITRVSCSTDVGTATIQIDERVETTPNTGGTDVMTAVLICDSNMEATTTFTNAAIAADAILNVDFDATATTPGIVRIHIDGTYDD